MVDKGLYPQALLWSGIDKLAGQVQDAADRYIVEAERVTLDPSRTDEWRR